MMGADYIPDAVLSAAVPTAAEAPSMMVYRTSDATYRPFKLVGTQTRVVRRDDGPVVGTIVPMIDDPQRWVASHLGTSAAELVVNVSRGLAFIGTEDVR